MSSYPRIPALLRPSALAVLLACVAPGAVSLAAAQSAAVLQSFSIPAGPMDATLTRIARQSGQVISIRPELVQGLKAPAIEGQMNAEQAYRQALKGSGLEVYATESGALNLRSASGKSTTLPEVVVTAQGDAGQLPAAYAGGMQARGGRFGMLGNADTMDVPFSMTSFTAKTVEDTQASTIADVVRLDPSVRSTGMAADNTDAFFVRGFALGDNNISEVSFDGLYGAGPNYRIMADYAERIEVLKGPAAMIYGMSPNGAGGGTINVVPKRAVADLSRAKLIYGNGSQAAGSVDLARRFGEQREFGVRLNGAYQNGDTALDNQSRRGSLGSIALDYQGEKLRATLDLIDQREDINAPSRRPSLVAGIAVPTAPDGRRNTTQAWEYSNSVEQSAVLRAEYEANEALSLFGGVAKSKSVVDRLFNTPTIFNAAGDVRTTPASGTFEVARESVEAGVRGKFATGEIKHKVTLQFNRYRDELSRATINGTTYTSNIYNPVNQPVQSVALPSDVPKVSETVLSGVALSDVISAYDERLQLILGLRNQTVEAQNFGSTVTTPRYDQTALTPAVGIVVKPQQNVSLYANYIEGLAKGDVAPDSASNAGQVFAPYKTKQYETGVKFDHGMLMTSLALFQITRPTGQLTSGVYAVDAEQQNRGVELSAYGAPMDGLRLYSGLTWIAAKLTDTNNAATRGNTAVGVPRLQGSVNAEWDLPAMRDLTLIGTVFYTGSQFVDQTNSREISSSTILDLGARYRSIIGGKNVVWRATLRNATGKDYWAGASTWGTLILGAPRTFLLSATMDF